MMQAREIIQKLLDREITIDQAVEAINSLVGKVLGDSNRISRFNGDLVKALKDCMTQIESFDKGGCSSAQPNGGRLAVARKVLETLGGL